MLKAKYYKDYRHNYMILESGEINDEKTYQYKMLESGKVDRLIKCSIRNVNGVTYFYYDITSKVSVENLYKGRHLSYEQVKDFFMQISMIYKNLSSFFMEEQGLLAKPEYIYFDLTSKKYFGVYYPKLKNNNESNINNRYEELMDFLLNHIDSSDPKLTDSIYKIYEMSEIDSFMLSDAFNILDEHETEEHHIEAVIEEKYPIDKADNVFENSMDQASAAESLNEEDYFEDYEDENDYLFLKENTRKKKDKPENVAKTGKDSNKNLKSKNIGKYYIVFAVISFVGLCAAGFIYYNYKLTSQEIMLIMCSLALMGLCFVFSVVQFMSFRKKSEKSEKAEQELQFEIEDEFRDLKPVVLKDILDKDEAAQSFRQEEDTVYGETVFIDTQKQKSEHKLYALDKKNKKHIELTQFPFTIGKMAGCVDCVLADESVSRLHARIEWKDEKILLTDMNSKNGTYKNGLRMEPSETVELEPGDEIRFGKLNYCYR